MKKVILTFCLLFSSLVYGAESTIPSGPKTQVLQRIDVPNTTYQEGMGTVRYLPYQIKPSQSQSGPELIYVISGTWYYIAKDKPEKIVEQGQSFQIPPGEIHSSKAGPKGATVVAAWVLDKTVPFVKPEK
ncbi:MAG: cupin domain-containing protein [Legionellales bacterium]|nr:cupin domain-containing protein [Legionellales bacterium]